MNLVNYSSVLDEGGDLQKSLVGNNPTNTDRSSSERRRDLQHSLRYREDLVSTSWTCAFKVVMLLL